MTIELPPEIEKRLRAAASERGIEVNEFVRRWLYETFPSVEDQASEDERPLTPEEKIRLLDEMAEENRTAALNHAAREIEHS